MEELMFCEILRTDIAAVIAEKKKMEFVTTITVRNIIRDPLSDDYLLLFVEDNIDEGTAVISKDSLGDESTWASFIGKTVTVKGFAANSSVKNELCLFLYEMKEV